MENFYTSIDKILDDKKTGSEKLAKLKDIYPDKKEFIEMIIFLMDYLPGKTHIPYETLSEYVYYLQNPDPEFKNFDKLRFALEAHLSHCGKCTEEFNLLKSELKETSEFVSIQFASKSEIPVKENIFFRSASMQYAAAAVLVIAIIYSGLYSFLNLNSPPFKQSVAADINIGVSRGRLTEEFQKSVYAIENENYSEAIVNLKDDIAKHSEDASVFYSEYLLGVSYLLTSERSFAGLFITHDPAKLDSAITHLKYAAELIKNSAFQNIKLDALYYSGRAYLLKDDLNNGKKYLQMVIDGKGKFAEKAKELLASLEE